MAVAAWVSRVGRDIVSEKRPRLSTSAFVSFRGSVMTPVKAEAAATAGEQRNAPRVGFPHPPLEVPVRRREGCLAVSEGSLVNAEAGSASEFHRHRAGLHEIADEALVRAWAKIAPEAEAGVRVPRATFFRGDLYRDLEVVPAARCRLRPDDDLVRPLPVT